MTSGAVNRARLVRVSVRGSPYGHHAAETRTPVTCPTILPVGNITPAIGDTHVAQCIIFRWPAFLHFGTEIAAGAIVENTLL